VLVLVVPLLPGGRSPFCLKQTVKQFNEKFETRHLASNFTLAKCNALGKRKRNSLPSQVYQLLVTKQGKLARQN